MPADEDYGRRHSILQHSATPSAATVAVSGDRFQTAVTSHGGRFTGASGDKAPQPAVERLEPPERFQTSSATVADRFASERSASDRLPSGERYQGVSERYPLGDRLQASISNERLVQSSSVEHVERHTFQPERYQYTERSSQKYSDRFMPIQNIGSLDRYQQHNHAALDRSSRTNTPTDRFNALYSDKERCGSSNSNSDRYTPVEKYSNNGGVESFERQNVCSSLGRRTPTSERTRREQNDRTDQYVVSQNVPSDVYAKRRDRSRSSERKSIDGFSTHTDSYRYGHDVQERFSTDRFPAIPCPERFATQERTDRPEKISFTQVPYLAPPSPAPTSDRFIPPPPLSPTNTPSPDCYASNTFPSPTNTVPIVERFVPPPPLSPSPTETFSPKKQREVYSDRYVSYQQDLYKDRNQYYVSNERYPAPHTTLYTPHVDRYITDRFGNERVPVPVGNPSNPHAPVERYTPQQQEPYYQYERCFPKYSNSTASISSTDPYMRRDLTYQYRVPAQQQQQQQQQQQHQNAYHHQRMRYMGTPNRTTKCCQYQDCYQSCKASSPCSSSNSSVTSQGKELLIQKDVVVGGASHQEVVQCQNLSGCGGGCGFHHHHHHQEKAIQCSGFQVVARVDKKDLSCSAGYVSPNLRTGKVQCRHSMCVSPSVEYVGQSGGRHVCATPPPRGSIGSIEGSICSDQCCMRRSQNTMSIWRSTPTPQPQQQSQQQQQPQQLQQQQIEIPSQSTLSLQQSSQQQAKSLSSPVNDQATSSDHQQEISKDDVQHPNQPALVVPQPTASPKPPSSTSTTVPRAISLPASPPERYRTLPTTGERRLEYTQSERIPNRPKLFRTISRKDAIKNYIKKETATFFGVSETNQEDEQIRWLDRRKRMASRSYGPLKAEYRTNGLSHRRTVSDIPTPQSGRMSAWRPDVLPGPSDVVDSRQDGWSQSMPRGKDSIARMTWDGLSYVVTTLTRHRPRQRSRAKEWSRSFPPTVVTGADRMSLEDDVFFEQTPPSPSDPALMDVRDSASHREPPIAFDTMEHPFAFRGWRRDPQGMMKSHSEHRRDIGGTRIFASLLDNVLDNSDRRQYGMGWVGRMFGRSFRSSVTRDEDIKQQLDDLEDHRPMFTYWVSTVQILILFISLICYGFGPFGVNLQSRSGQVLVPSLSLQQVEYTEPANFWGGPRAADLIHLGAKFAPCMRIDDKIHHQIEKTRTKERETACCIRNDDSGCVQSSRADCSNTISTWKKWTPRDAGPGGRISGSVCGLDPKFCNAPASVHPYEWPDDITKWPICRKNNIQYLVPQNVSRDKSAEHMICEVIGHPCCIGIHGMCKITTREYCDFVKGAFHEEASLCSQVSCLDDVCGMVPFYFDEVPDQFYRLWTSLFLHAGILQLLLTLFVQYFLMRDLEKLTGSLRIAIIYLGSGMAGNLASAIFIPYRADVGPSGSHFGLLACLIVEVLNAWPMLKHPNQALCKLISITVFLFIIGLLPWVDNYAHLFGFVFGFLLSYALLPFITFGPYDRQKKIIVIWLCLLSAAFLFICLVLLFYIIPVYDCEVCSYFNCVPITREFCASQNINFKREDYVV